MKPSDHLARGECPYCCGTGEVENMIYGVIPCHLCKSTKKWPPPDEKEPGYLERDDGSKMPVGHHLHRKEPSHEHQS